MNLSLRAGGASSNSSNRNDSLRVSMIVDSLSMTFSALSSAASPQTG